MIEKYLQKKFDMKYKSLISTMLHNLKLSSVVPMQKFRCGRASKT